MTGVVGCGAGELLHRQLRQLGARPVAGTGPGAGVEDRAGVEDGAGVSSARLTGAGGLDLRCGIDWYAPDRTVLDEVTAQAAFGLMAVHGRARGGPARLGVDYVTTATGILAGQGVLAALLAWLRGTPVRSVGVSAASAALLTVGQYLADGSADDPDDDPGGDPAGTGARGAPPPFVCADGVRVELEALAPEPWLRLWSALAVEPAVVARGWRAFVLRYATATAPIPIELHRAVGQLPYARFAEVAAAAGVAVQPLRGLEQRRGDPDPAGVDRPPWTVRDTDASHRGRGPHATRPPAAAPSPAAPLAGLRVVDAGRRIQGPLAGHILRLLGADVIRVEPVGGDPLRGMAPMVGDCSARYLALNRGKAVVQADLRQPSGRAVLRDLAATADVFLHNWAPGKAAALGLEADDLAGANPTLVYAHASGWGEERGSDAPPGTDFVAQAYAGLGELLRPVGEPPAPTLFTVLDVLGGLTAAQGVLAALVARELGVPGQRVETSLLSAAGVLQAPALRGRRPPRPVWGPRDVPLATADGYLVLPDGGGHGAMPEPGPEPGPEPEPAELAAVLAGLPGLPTAAAVARLRSAGIAAVPVCGEPGRLAADPAFAQLLEVDGCAFVQPPWRFVS